MIRYEVSLSNGTAFMDVVRVEALDETNALEVAVAQGYGLWTGLEDMDNFEKIHDLIDNQDEYLYLDLTPYGKDIGLLYIVGASIKEIEED